MLAVRSCGVIELSLTVFVAAFTAGGGTGLVTPLAALELRTCSSDGETDVMTGITGD
jgi:hypothetical protein